MRGVCFVIDRRARRSFNIALEDYSISSLGTFYISRDVGL